jgi:acyl-CoA thioesterase I
MDKRTFIKRVGLLGTSSLIANPIFDAAAQTFAQGIGMLQSADSPVVSIEQGLSTTSSSEQVTYSPSLNNQKQLCQPVEYSGKPFLEAASLPVEDTLSVANPATYLAPLSETMKVVWPKNHTVNIVCHGHSVPSGYFKTPLVDTFNAYPYLLHRGLKERFPYAVINVIVTGIGGEQSEAGAKRFANDVLNHRPDLITIDYALNDRSIGLKRAEAAWESMIAAAEAAHIPVILLTPTPDQAARLDDPQDPLNQHDEQIRRLAATHHLALVDSLAAFKTRIADGTRLSDLMSQRNHPNRAGHDLVASAMLAWFP